MSLRPLLVASALSVLVLGGCSGSRAGQIVDDTPGSAAHLTPRALADTPFERTWNLALGEAVHTSWTSPAMPEVIFFQLAESRRVIAVDAFSGTTRWVTEAMPDLIQLPPSAVRSRLPAARAGQVLTEDRVFILAQDVLHVIDGATGHLVWRYTLPFSPSTGPTAVGTDASLRVFIGDWSGRLQTVAYHQEKNFPYVVWQWPVGASLGATPVEFDEQVYLGDHHGVVGAYKLDRAQAWQRELGGGIYGSPLARERVLYVGNTDGILYAINRLTGEPLGKLNLGSPILRAPFAFKNEPNRVYVWTGLADGVQTLVAINAQSDNVPFADTARHALEVVRLGVEWRRPSFERLVGSTPEYLYGTTAGSFLVQALNRRTGRIDWTWDAASVFPRSSLEHLLTYQDPRDRLRSIIAIDDEGKVVVHRFLGVAAGDHDDVPAPADAAPVLAPSKAKLAKDAAAKEKEAAAAPAK